MSTTAELAAIQGIAVVRQQAEADMEALQSAPYQSAWDTAVQCRTQGVGDITAIQNVYDVMPPPAPLTQLATIIGAIYADTYWATTRLDPARLSSSLQKAGGWNKADCDQAAQVAFSQWYGLLVRCNFSDTGLIPRGNDVTNSPDVLCNADGALTQATMLQKWGSRFYNGAPGLKNYTYTRCASVGLPVNVTKPRVRMFYTTGGFNQPPTSWQILYTFDKQIYSPLEGMAPGPIPEGGRAANINAFNFETMGSGHYCLLTAVSTEFFDNNPLGSGSSNWDSYAWITNNGAAGWHNIDVPKAEVSTLAFYNQDARPERFVFEAHASRVPAGTHVSVTPADAELARGARPGPGLITAAQQVVSSGEIEVPAHYSGDLQVRIATPGGEPLPDNAAVDVRAYWVLDHGHPHYADAVGQLRAHADAEARRPVRLLMGQFTFVGKIV